MNFKFLIVLSSFLFLNFVYSYDASYLDQKRLDKSNYVFDINSIPLITIDISANQWNSLLTNFDKNKRNEIEVTTDFVFDKNGKIDVLKNVGVRIRGNTSRKRPEGKKGELHNSVNPDWKHAHFRLDLKEKGNKKSDFYTLKNLNLKWFKDDATYVREIYCYDLFKRFGVFTAPRSSYCRLYVKIKEDEKPAYFGVYEMVEPIDKRYLKTRFNKTKKMDEGDLWKCLWGANLKSLKNVGIEDPDNGGKIVEYDLKTNKKDFENAKKRLSDFVTNLNKLKDKEFYPWIKKNFDVDLFLKTYAVNVIVGMWDDYWANNGNNYYLYADDKGKFYFIPYDYDNTLGTSLIVGNSGYSDIFNWGDKNAVLIRRILSIKEFKDKYAFYISELIDPSKDLFDAEKSILRIKKWQEMIKPYVSNDTGEDMEIVDKPARWANCHFYRLLSGDDGGFYPEANYFRSRIRFAKENLKSFSDVGAYEKYSEWLMNSPFVERSNYSVDIVVGVKNSPKTKMPVKVKYLVLDVGSKIPEVDEVAYPDKSDYSDIRGSGIVEFTGSKFNLVQIHNLEILKEYDVYFIIENEDFTFPKQLMKKVTIKPESPKIISPEISFDKIVFRCYNSNPDASLYVSGDFNERALSAGVGIEGRRLKDDDKNKIFEVVFDKSLVKKGDRYLFYYSKNEEPKDGFTDSCNKLIIKGDDSIFYSVIE